MFRELLPFLKSRASTLEMKGTVYASSVISSMTYGSRRVTVVKGSCQTLRRHDVVIASNRDVVLMSLYDVMKRPNITRENILYTT